MKHVFEGIGVDSGLIIICDADYFAGQPWGKAGPHLMSSVLQLGKTVELPAGKYKIAWNIADTWNGPVSGDGELTVTSGTVIVMDPCYGSNEDHDAWSAFCDRIYDSWNITRVVPDPGTVILDSMGGDGCYEVEVEFTPIANSEEPRP